MVRWDRVGGLARRVAAWELPLVLLVLPGLILRPMWVSAAAVAVLWLCRWMAWGRLTRPAPPNLPLLLLGALIPVSLAITPTPAATRVQAGYLLAGLALYFAVLNWAVDARRLQTLLGGVMVVALGLALFSPLLIESHEGFRWLPAGWMALARRLPERINPNVLAGNLAPLWPLTLALAWRPPGERGWWWRGLAGGVTLVLGLVLLGLASRGIWLALGLTGLLLLPLRWPGLRRGWPLAVALIWLVIAQRLPERLAAVTLDTGALGGWTVRTEIWQRAAFALGDFALTGMGMGAWAQVAPVLYPYLHIGANTTVPHAHQLFLQVGLDLGVPGLTLFLATIGLGVWMAWQSYRRYRDGTEPENRSRAALALALLASFLIILSHGLVDAVSWGTKPAVFTWLVLALTTVLYLNAETAPTPTAVAKAGEG
ncbi:MAG: O-antigen ligase family protein [Caldilineales bacterium]|nr:O-antigen ligase family protein [Caldilineales bacterium]